MAKSSSEVQLLELKDMISQLNTTIKMLNETINRQQKENDNLKAELAWFRQKMFGASSERRIDDFEGQLSLFDEMDEFDKPILDEQFHPERPNAVWCSDITYIWTIDGFVYLTSIMDLYSRKIIAWTLSKTLEVSCVIETIKKAKARRNIDKPLILHSDRGSQYVSKEYKRVTATMQCSYGVITLLAMKTASTLMSDVSGKRLKPIHQNLCP